MSLDLVKCGMCGKAVVVANGQRHICEVCRDEEQQLYTRIRLILREYPGARYTIKEIADMIKVDERKIHHLVDNGYFKLTLQGIRLCYESNERDSIF